MSSLRYLLKEGFKNIWTNSLMAFASFGVLSCCLLMIGCSTLLVYNISEAFKNIEAQNVMKVYLKEGTDQETIDSLIKRFNEMDNISNCEYISPEQALDEFIKENEDYEAAFSGLVYDNPLPPTFKLTVADLTRYQDTYNEVAAISAVEAVGDQSEAAQKLLGIREFIAIISFWIVGILAVVSLFIISNTIRITMYGRRLEISIMKSVGATDSFVTIPFVVEGIIMGFISSIVSFFILWYIYNSANSVMVDIIGIQIIPFSQVCIPIAIIFVVVGLFAGSIGSILSIRRYLKNEGGSVYDAI